MYSVSFGNTTVQCEDFYLESDFWNNANRPIAVFMFSPSDVSVDTLNTIVSSEDNTNLINVYSVVEGEDSQLVSELEKYNLKVSIALQATLISEETPDAPAEFQDKIFLRLARRTYTEQYIHDHDLSEQIVNIITEGE